MLRNLFWIFVGGGLVVLVVLKGRKLMQQATPKAVAERAQATAASLGERAGDFISTVREAAAEREAELRQAMALDAEPATDVS